VTGAILLTAAVVMGTGLVSWSNSKLTTFETLLSTTSSSLTNKANENLLIENVIFCYSACNSPYNGPVINATLTNSGSIGLNVTKIQAANYSWVLSPPVSLMPLKSYTFQQHFQWTSKTPYSISVTSARNSVYVTQASPP
jgi:hypothetical protein